jgi:hypothetical protein
MLGSVTSGGFNDALDLCDGACPCAFGALGGKKEKVENRIRKVSREED